jgi:HEAT repeat protein
MASLLQIRGGEGKLVVLLTTLFFVANMGGAIASPGVEALFYARFGVDYLPFMYVYLGLITMLVTMLLSGLIGRLSRKLLYLGLPPALALTLIVSRLLVGMKLIWFYPVLWLWIYVLWTLQALFTWGLSGMVCDPRQAKRLFPLFGGGGILGIALGGLITQPLVGMLGAENLLLVWAVGLVVAFGLVRILSASFAQGRTRSRWQTPPGLIEEVRKDFLFVRQSSLMRWIALGAVLFSVLYFSLAFPFSKAVAAWFSNEDMMAGFLGLFQGVSTALAFIISLFLANRLYAAAGFMTTLLAFTLIYLFGFGVLLISATFFLLVGVRFIQMVWMQGVADSAFQATFNLVPDKRREQVRAFINGFPQQIGVVMTGLILIIGQQWLRPQHLYLIGILAAVIATAVIWRGSRVYKKALVEALHAGLPNVFSNEQTPFGGFHQDATAINTVVSGLSKPDPRIRFMSAEILANITVPAAAPSLVMALEDPDESVRAAALKALANAKETSALLEVAACLDDPDPEVRFQAMEALYRLTEYPRGLAAHLDARLEDPEPRVRARAASLLLVLGDHPRARAILPPMLASTDPQVRRAALEVYSAWGDPSGYVVAEEFLHDPAPVVRQMAARALAQIDPEHSQSKLVMALSDENQLVRDTAAELLGKMGVSALPAVLDALDQDALESGALMALKYLPLLGESKEIRAYGRRKSEIALRYGTYWRNVTQVTLMAERLELLAEALLEVARRHAAQAVQAFCILEDPSMAPSVLEGLESPNALLRANALEILENMSGGDTLRPIFFLWEPDSSKFVNDGDSQPDFASDDNPLVVTLLELLQEPDDWLCACAVLAFSEVDDPRLNPALVKLSEKENSPLLTETIALSLDGADMKSLPTIPIMERILYLRKVPIFAGLSPVELKQIATIAGEHLFTSGEVFAHQGEVGDEMFIVVSGEVEVRVRKEDQEEVVITRRKPGEFVGEMSIISNQPRMASLAAIGEVRALCVEKMLFESMLHERPEVGLALIRALVERLRDQDV